MVVVGVRAQVSDYAVMSSFSQGSANNCASVALIKAAMYRYGYENIFRYEREGDLYKVVLKDGTKLSITGDELSLAKRYADFDTSGSRLLSDVEREQLLHYAYLAYACIAKNIALNGYWGCVDDRGNSNHYNRMKHYSRALHFITRTSFCTDNCHRLLGLKIRDNKILDYTGAQVLADKGIILYSWGHAVAVYDNKLDCHGEWLPVTADKVCYNKFKWYLVLE